VPIELDELAERMRRVGRQWEDLMSDSSLGEREATASDGYRIPGWVPLAQAIHHADDHRTTSCRYSAPAV
jgi:hypothetical protein